MQIRSSYLMLLVSVVIAATSCSRAGTINPTKVSERALDDAQRRAIVTTVDSAMHAYLNAVAARDAGRAIGFFANDPEFVVNFDGTAMNYDAMASSVRAMFGGLSAVELQPVTVSVTVLGRDAAIAAFSFRETFTDTAKKITRLRGTASWTWQRRPTGWAIIHGDAVHLPDAAPAAR